VKTESPVSYVAFVFAAFLALAPCAPGALAQPAPTTRDSSGADGGGTVTIEPGEAGGVVEDTFSVTVTVTAIDPSTRSVTLAGEDGSKATFTAPPEIRNFDQIHVGDKVNATIAERLVVFVRSGTTQPSVSHAAALARAPKGAKPGALIAETFEIVATVKSIDTEKRTATLQFADGQTKTVPVRRDVDLSRYKVGDSVVIRITKALSVLVAKP
jgi:hypothetical protein